MEYTTKVKGCLRCNRDCNKYKDNRCCINCGTDIRYCTEVCEFIAKTLAEGKGIGKDDIKENCDKCIKQ